VQQQIAFDWNRQQLGSTMDVLLDRPLEDQPNVYVGRTYADAPDVDGLVYVTGERCSAGDLMPCEIVTSKGYDLVAAAIGPAR